jgi:hypothetical protein
MDWVWKCGLFDLSLILLDLEGFGRYVRKNLRKGTSRKIKFAE